MYTKISLIGIEKILQGGGKVCNIPLATTTAKHKLRTFKL
jgi:hypothetical protein